MLRVGSRASSSFRIWERNLFVLPRVCGGARSLSNVDAGHLPESLKGLNPKVDKGFSAWIEATHFNRQMNGKRI
jgi:hypothetical protein